MPIEREFLHRQIERRARKAHDPGDLLDFRAAIRTLEGDDVRGHDANALFVDISDRQLIGIDAVLGTMKT